MPHLTPPAIDVNDPFNFASHRLAAAAASKDAQLPRSAAVAISVAAFAVPPPAFPAVAAAGVSSAPRPAVAAAASNVVLSLVFSGRGDDNEEATEEGTVAAVVVVEEETEHATAPGVPSVDRDVCASSPPRRATFRLQSGGLFAAAASEEEAEAELEVDDPETSFQLPPVLVPVPAGDATSSAGTVELRERVGEVESDGASLSLPTEVPTACWRTFATTRVSMAPTVDAVPASKSLLSPPPPVAGAGGGDAPGNAEITNGRPWVSFM